MTQLTQTQNLSHRHAFLHWEAHPSQTRERLKVSTDAKAGDVLILNQNQEYESFAGVGIAPNPNTLSDGQGRAYQQMGYSTAGVPRMAIVLEDVKAGQSALCITRLATTIIIQELNHLTTEVLKGEGGAELRTAANAQSIRLLESAPVATETHAAPAGQGIRLNLEADGHSAVHVSITPSQPSIPSPPSSPSGKEEDSEASPSIDDG